MKAKITKTTVDDLRQRARADGKTIYCWDTELTNFGVLATKAGNASYFIEYRIGGRKAPNKRVTIAKHGPKTADEARKIAKVELGKVSDGIDVARTKKDERLKLAAGTFKEIAEKYLKKEAKPTDYWAETRSILKRDAYTAFGSQPISTITKQQIRAQLDKVGARAPSAERKLYAALSPLFKWAVERGTPEHNPMAALSKPKPASKRKRTLVAKEIKAFWEAVSELSYPFGPLYKLLLLTGQRREEVAGMCWEELNLKKRIWRLPPKEEVQPQRTKNGLEHIIDLNSQALVVLAALAADIREAGNEPKGLVFTTTGTTPVSGFGKIKERIDAEMLKRMGGAPPPWRNHDLRRTMSTLMAEDLGIDEGVIERILNHISTTGGGLKGVYQLQQYRKKRELALNAWGDHVERLATTKGNPLGPVHAA